MKKSRFADGSVIAVLKYAKASSHVLTFADARRHLSDLLQVA